MTNKETMLISGDSDSSPTLRELYLELGRALSVRQRYKEAVTMFQQALKEQDTLPEESLVLFHLARSQDQAGDYQRAFRSYLEVILVAPERSEAVLPFAHNLLTRSSIESEREWLQDEWIQKIGRADLTEVDGASIAFFLGRVNIYLGEYSQALVFFEKAMGILSNDVRVVEGFGEALWKTGKLEQALEALERAYEMTLQGMHQERLAFINIKLAQVQVASGQYATALSLITDIQTDDERLNYELLLTRGECYLGLSQPEQALEALEAAIQSNAADVRAYLLQVQSFIALNRYKEAVSSADQALQYDPFNLQIGLYKSQALIEGHIDLEQARQLLEFYTEQAGSEEAVHQIHSTVFTRRSKEGNLHYFFAQFYYTLGHLTEALQEINQALDLGLTGENDYPDAPALQLKARILQDSDAKEDAATCYYEAGRSFYWRDEYEVAVDLFKDAAELQPDFTPIYWYWADALLMHSYISESPYVDKKHIEKSLEVWESAINTDRPDTEYAWAYISRARINEQLARLSDATRWTFLPETTRWNLWWEAIIYLERAILMGRQDTSTWATLGHFHRFLSNEANALHITHILFNDESENLFVLEERAAILADVGELTEAEVVINKYLELVKNEFGKAIKAYIILHNKRYKEALSLLDDVLKNDPSYIWVRDLRAFCYLIMEKPSQAAEDYRWIWSRYDPDDSYQLHVYAWAAYSIGEIDKAIEIFEKIHDDPSQERGRISFNLGLCYLAQHKLEQGEDFLSTGIEQMINMKQLDDIHWDFAETEKRSLNWPSIDQYRLQEVLSRLKKVIEKQRKKVKRPRSPEYELKQVLKKYPRNDKMGSWAWIAGQAGLAHIYNEEKRWVEAAKTYQLLLKEGELFPEAHIGLEQAIENLQKEGDDCSIAGEFEKALEWFSHALTFALKSLPDDSLRQANLHGRLGFVYFNLSDLANTGMNFMKAVQLYRENNTPDPGDALGKVYRSLLRDAAQYWSLEARWSVLLDDSKIDESLRSDLTAVRESLAGYLDELFQLSGQFQTTSSPLPVVLEIGEGLIPEDTSYEWALFKVYIPEMRQRFQDEMGVEVPDIRVRGNNALPRHQYNILLYENPLVIKGSVTLGRRYCPTSSDVLKALGIPMSVLIEAPHPRTGVPGCWISPDNYELVLSHNLALWAEPLVYIIYHLEAILHRNLAIFWGIQEVEKLLNGWEQDENGRSLIASVLPDQRARFHLSRVLRTLIQEHVPIKAWRDILEALQGPVFAEGNIGESVRDVRLRLKQWLPGNNPVAQRLELFWGWENSLALGLEHRDGGIYFTAPPVETSEFLSMIRDQAHSDGWNEVLVTQNAELRPFIRLLVEAVFPSLMVLAQEETLVAEELLADQAVQKE